MSFFAILFALLIEQARPLAAGNPVHAGLRRWARFCARNFDAGARHHGWVAWTLAVAGPTLAALLVHLLLVWTLGWAVGVLWSVAVLYVTLGFRQFSHHFTEIRDALDAGDDDRARALLARWQQVDTAELPRGEVLRHLIEVSVLAAHRHVFGVLGWFAVLSALGLGPAGAVLYRMAEFVGRYWSRPVSARSPLASAALADAARRAWHSVDWLPARGTALSFAVVGNFEEAIDGWRQHARRHPQDNDGLILAATAGAINVQLGGAGLRPAFAPERSQGFQADAWRSADADPLPGRPPQFEHLRSVVGLVWRAVVLWMLLLALLSLARVLG